MEQLSPEWFAARLGKVTASRMADLCATTRNGYGSSRKNYMAELVVERLTGAQQERFQNDAMKWGVEKEPNARAAYVFRNNAKVDSVGFIDHPRIKMSGASPDGHIGDDGSLEVKCPLTATHIEYLTSQVIPEKYILQMQWQLACSGRAWCDFVSYDPRLPEGISLWVKRVPRDSKMIPMLEKEVTAFLTELDEMVAKLRAMMPE